MHSLIAVLFAFAAAARVMAQSTDGMTDGFYYNFWTDGGSKPWTCMNSAGGQFNVSWGPGGNFVCGKGWRSPFPTSISYSGTFRPSGNGYLSIYTWSCQGAICTEFYVVDSFGTYNPASGQKVVGNVTSDGGIYDLVVAKRILPGIDIDRRLTTYWSVRRDKRVGGTVSLANHFDAWEPLGFNRSTTFGYVLVAVEGYQSSGSADITVRNPTTTTTPTTTTPAPVTTTPAPVTTTPVPISTTPGAPRWAQCGGIGWKGATSCSEGTCTKINDWYSQCL